MFRTRIFLAFVLLVVSDTLSAQSIDSLRQIDHFGKNPGNLAMYVYGNATRTDSGLKPLVVVLHGCGQTAAEVARLTGWNKLAAINDFVVLYPQQRVWNNMSTCFNWFRKNDIGKGMGECESIYQAIRYMIQTYPVDSSRIFITGLSAGAAMSVVLMATHPEQFKSGAIFAGGAYQLADNAFESVGMMAGTKRMKREELARLVKDQNPGYAGAYPSMIIYQGLEDLVVNRKNALLLIEQWTGLQGCNDIADKREQPFMNVNDISRMEFTDSTGKPVVIYYEVKNLGHRVLVNPGNDPNQGGEVGTYGADRNFHSTWQTAKDFGILRK